MIRKIFKKSSKKTQPKLRKEEVEEIIINLAKTNTPEKIGLILKQKYNSPIKAYNQKINKILKKYNLNVKSDLINIEKKIEKLKKHLNKNKQDYRTKRTLQTLSGRLNKLRRYYQKNE